MHRKKSLWALSDIWLNLTRLPFFVHEQVSLYVGKQHLCGPYRYTRKRCLKRLGCPPVLLLVWLVLLPPICLAARGKCLEIADYTRWLRWLHQVATLVFWLLKQRKVRPANPLSCMRHWQSTSNETALFVQFYRTQFTKTDALQAQDWKAQKIKDRWYVQGASFYACLTSSYSQASLEEILLQPKQKRY